MKTAFSRFASLSLTVAMLGIGCQSMRNDGEQEIALADAPEAVQAAIKQFVGNRELDEIVREQEGGVTVYEAEVDVDDLDHTITVRADGTVIEEEMEVKPASLPAAVTSAVNAKYPNAKITEAASVKKDGKTFFEVTVKTSGGGDREMNIAADGSTILEDSKSDQDDDD